MVNDPQTMPLGALVGVRHRCKPHGSIVPIGEHGNAQGMSMGALFPGDTECRVELAGEIPRPISRLISTLGAKTRRKRLPPESTCPRISVVERDRRMDYIYSLRIRETFGRSAIAVTRP